jgi:hypothetical protein
MRIQKKILHTSMCSLVFDSLIPVLERSDTLYALDGAVAVSGLSILRKEKYEVSAKYLHVSPFQIWNKLTDVRFEDFTAVTMKNAVFLDVAPCRCCVNRRFGGTYRLHLQGRKIRERGTSVSRWPQAAVSSKLEEWVVISAIENTRTRMERVLSKLWKLAEYILGQRSTVWLKTE